MRSTPDAALPRLETAAEFPMPLSQDEALVLTAAVGAAASLLRPGHLWPPPPLEGRERRAPPRRLSLKID